MRDILLSVVVCAALAGCDGKTETTSSVKPTGSGDTASTSAVAAKTETPKSSAPKHLWGSFKKGSSAKLKTVTDTAGTKSEMTMTHTLVDLTADEAVVETEMAMTGFTNKSTNKFPLKAPEGGKAVDGPKPKTGSEEIEVAGKKLKCTWTEIETETAGIKTTAKSWMCEDVPGHLVKSVSKSTGAATMSSTTELVEYAVK
jgi:hypothetical protein